MNALAVSCITFFTLSCNLAFLRFLLIPKTSFISCDWFVSQHVKKALEEQPLPKSILSSERYINEALNELPVLQAVHVHMHRYKSMYVKAEARTPWIRINNDLVLTRDAFVVPAHFFNTELTHSLTKIKATRDHIEPDSYNNELFNFLNNLPQALVYDSAITWHNKTYICLKTILFPKITLIAHYATRFDAQLLTTLEKISTDIATLKTKNTRAYADVRFKNQIILSHKKEEAL